MGLVYWLPLINDVHNQGLEDVDITYTNLTWVNGKIGTAPKWSLSTSDTLYLRGAASRMCNMQYYSMCAWVKVVDSFSGHSQAIISSGNWNRADTLINFAINKSGSSVKMLITASRGWDTGVDITDYFTFDEWHHVCMTWDGNKTNAYVDGVLCGSIQYGGMPSTYNVADVLIGGATYTTPTFRFNGLMNDIRIYDHCLSPLEVKHLAQGLVLHYPLSDPYIESTTNLITTEDCLSSTCFNAATTKYGYGANTDIYKTVTTYDGRKGTKVYMGTNGNSCYPYVYVNNMYTSDGSNAPAYKTLSFDYYGTIGNYLGPYKLGSGGGTATYTVTCQGIKTTGTYSNSGGFTVTPNKWNHVEITFHGTTAANSQWGYIKIGNGNHTSNTSNFWFFANMQLEAKDHATGYAGVGGTRTSATVYDTSGYGNNGIINGELTISDDTAKYNISTKFNGTTSDYIQSNPLPLETQTISFWIKTGTIADSRVVFVDYGSKIAFGFNSSNTAYIVCTLPTGSGYSTGSRCVAGNNWKSNDWNHFVIVKLTSNPYTYKTYLNGVLLENSRTNYWTHTTNDLIIGKRSVGSPFSGQLSDFRAYATALSAEDVYNLYAAGASISNTGVLFSNEVSEV